jgi:Fe-S-cluster containining protein
VTDTKCARCGDCCDPVLVGFHVEAWVAARLAEPDLAAYTRANAEFLARRWTTTATLVREDEDCEVVVGYEVRCDAFNRETRSCDAHADRPPICRDYPWYGRPPADVEGRAVVAEGLSPRCSFNADVPGRRFLPLVDVSGRPGERGEVGCRGEGGRP